MQPTQLAKRFKPELISADCLGRKLQNRSGQTRRTILAKQADRRAAQAARLPVPRILKKLWWLSRPRCPREAGEGDDRRWAARSAAATAAVAARSAITAVAALGSAERSFPRILGAGARGAARSARSA